MKNAARVVGVHRLALRSVAHRARVGKDSSWDKYAVMLDRRRVDPESTMDTTIGAVRQGTNGTKLILERVALRTGVNSLRFEPSTKFADFLNEVVHDVGRKHTPVIPPVCIFLLGVIHPLHAISRTLLVARRLFDHLRDHLSLRIRLPLLPTFSRARQTSLRDRALPLRATNSV